MAASCSHEDTTVQWRTKYAISWNNCIKSTFLESVQSLERTLSDTHIVLLDLNHYRNYVMSCLLSCRAFLNTDMLFCSQARRNSAAVILSSGLGSAGVALTHPAARQSRVFTSTVLKRPPTWRRHLLTRCTVKITSDKRHAVDGWITINVKEVSGQLALFAAVFSINPLMIHKLHSVTW